MFEPLFVQIRHHSHQDMLAGKELRLLFVPADGEAHFLAAKCHRCLEASVLVATWDLLRVLLGFHLELSLRDLGQQRDLI